MIAIPAIKEFEQADTDHEGRVVLAEGLRSGGAEASFLAADFDHKGGFGRGTALSAPVKKNR